MLFHLPLGAYLTGREAPLENKRRPTLEVVCRAKTSSQCLSDCLLSLNARRRTAPPAPPQPLDAETLYSSVGELETSPWERPLSCQQKFRMSK
ncbi:hypothetical protein EVAR_19655_1 [Eumeta japonica]|uniref:Uncharacterized protein n=1 Tax=Eumeta variegata TaxID=151549 RepID=A0A4C1V426_EUMVA|nr:hypothetical protein EVAR_19655_1 [Eumeta japonica]